MALLSFSVLPAELPPLVAEPGGFVLIGPAAWADHGVAAIDAAPFRYEDLLASVDVVVSMAGYATVAELGCSGIPAVLVDRPDWPEQPFLVEWLQTHGRCLIAPHVMS
jgi:UDP-N-acetylglucosamine:LPS N-acetylglucosamine transferase